jgi:hypothetical protein
MRSDQRRLQEAMNHIRRIKAGDYPAIIGTEGAYRIVERPWQDIPEGSKLAILQEAVNWSGVSNRDQAHILLSEIDLGKIADSERNRLIGMAQERPTLKDILEGSFSMEAREQGQERDLTSQQLKELFKEMTQDRELRKQMEAGLAPDDRPREQERDRGIER